MSTPVNRVFTEALAMPSELRALLVNQLLDTLDDDADIDHASQDIDDDVTREHLLVVRRRLSEIRSGSAETVSADEASERIRRILEE
jgi:hypothetical protein